MDPRLERVMFVHAHPDDETLSTGAAIAAVAAGGGDAVVVTFTLGERGEVRPERMSAVEQVGIGEVRRAELDAALRALGARGRRIHGWDDSGMAWHRSGKAGAAPDAPPTSMSRADIDDLADALSVAVEEVDPTALVTYDADGGYGHPDHVAVHHATVAVARRYDLPLYVRTVNPADVSFALAPVRDRVRAALAEHSSQLTVDGDDVLHVGGQRRPIDAIEHYRLIEARPKRSARWLLRIGALLAGLVVGVVGTFSHQQLPWGLGLSLIAAIGLIVGIRAASGSRPMTLAAVIGVVGVIAIIAIDPLGRGAWGTERSLVPANLAGWLWSLLPALASLVALAWPDAEALRRIRMVSKSRTEGEADR